MSIQIDDGTERRMGLHELAEQIKCLREEFVIVKDKFEHRLNGVERWISNVTPTISAIRKAMWIVSGASAIVALLATIVVWIWLQDHVLLKDISRLVLVNTKRIDYLENEDLQQDKRLERLDDEHSRFKLQPQK